MPVSRRDLLGCGLASMACAFLAEKALAQTDTIVVVGRDTGEAAPGPPTLSLPAKMAYPPQIDVDLDVSYVAGDSLQIQGADDTTFGHPVIDVTVVLDPSMAAAHKAIVAALAGIAAPRQTIFRARGIRAGRPSPWSSLVRHGDDRKPVIQSPRSANFQENNPVAYKLVADKDVSWSILPSADASLVEIFGGTVIRLNGNAAPDFEKKQTYSLIVKATDLAGNIATQPVLLRITDVDELYPSTWGTSIKSPYVTLDHGNLTVAAMDANVGAGCRVRATNARSGRKYFEVHMDEIGHKKNFVGLCSSLVNISGDYDAIGGNASDGACLSVEGDITHNGTVTHVPELAFATGDTIMIAFNSATKMIWFGKNGKWIGDPASGAGGNSLGTTADFYAFAAVCPALGGSDRLTANFGATPFKYAKPRGFLEYI